MLYQKNGVTDFAELWDIDSSNNKGANTVVTSESGCKWFFACKRTKERH